MQILASILIITIAFYLMARIVDEYFLVSLDNISKWLNLTPSVAGATLMAMGTSAPELSTALFALFLPNTNPATGIGTIVGSAIFQILVVIGFAALVKTSYLNWKPVIRDGVFYAFSVGILILFVADGVITRIEGGLFVFAYLLYLFTLFMWTKFVDESHEPDPIELFEEGQKTQNGVLKVAKKAINVIFKPFDVLVGFIPNPQKSSKNTVVVFFISLASIGFLSYWLVIAAEDLAFAFGIPSAIVALTILAGGSSIPELIGSAIVSKQGRGDMAISNAIGSNIFDILISLGFPVFLYTLVNGSLTDVGGSNIASSILLLFATLIAVLLLLVSQKFRVGKWFGVSLIGAYVLYVIAAYTGFI